MANNPDNRIIVSGIMKGPVRCSEKEEELRCFFHDAGCKVAEVNLVMDTRRRDRSRGLGFVCFEDLRSLNLALKLHNKEAPRLAGKDGKLRIERAHVDESSKAKHNFAEARNQTKEMERELASQEARLEKLIQELKRKCEWQNLAKSHGQQLQEEKRRQAALQHAMETIKDVAQRIHTAIEVDVFSTVHGEQTRRHKDESPVSQDPCATSAFFPQEILDAPTVTSDLQHKGGANQSSCTFVASLPTTFDSPAHRASFHPPPDAAECTADDQEEQVEICVRNTFIDVGVPEAQPLLRIRSHPERSRSPDSWDYFSAAHVSKALLQEKMDGASDTDASTAATSEQESNPDQ